MKNTVLAILILSFSLGLSNAQGQEITKYDYLEVIVVQKANNSGKVKRIKVEEQKSLEGKLITVDALEDLDNTSELLNYMNAANWEFVDRQSVVSEENDPVWMSYIFRKQKPAL